MKLPLLGRANTSHGEAHDQFRARGRACARSGERLLLRAFEQVRAGKAFLLRGVQPKSPRKPSSS
jgi:hypothetical protein